MLLSFYALPCLLGFTFASPVPMDDLNNGELAKKETPENAFLTILLKLLPPIDGTIAAVGGALTDFEELLVIATGDQDTYNELGGPCTEYTLVFARGTTEPGNVGILVGPPFITALKSLVGDSALTVQGVNNYGATIDQYLEGGDPVGSVEM
jgi:cutinase